MQSLFQKNLSIYLSTLRWKVIATDFTTEANTCITSASNWSFYWSISWFFDACYDRLLLKYTKANANLRFFIYIKNIYYQTNDTRRNPWVMMYSHFLINSSRNMYTFSAYLAIMLLRVYYKYASLQAYCSGWLRAKGCIYNKFGE